LDKLRLIKQASGSTFGDSVVRLDIGRTADSNAEKSRLMAFIEKCIMDIKRKPVPPASLSKEGSQKPPRYKSYLMFLAVL